MSNSAEYFNQFYKNHPNPYGSPNEFVELVKKHISKENGSILDVGAGLGRHSIMLANNGFKVDAVEQSIVAIEEMYAKIESDPTLNKNVTLHHKNINKFNLKSKYDAIISVSVMETLELQELFTQVPRMKESTLENGINAHTVPFYDAYIPKSQFLFQIYQDWKIEECFVKPEIVFGKHFEYLTFVARKPN